VPGREGRVVPLAAPAVFLVLFDPADASRVAPTVFYAGCVGMRLFVRRGAWSGAPAILRYR
jgi:hypothetical protein